MDMHQLRNLPRTRLPPQLFFSVHRSMRTLQARSTGDGGDMMTDGTLDYQAEEALHEMHDD